MKNKKLKKIIVIVVIGLIVFGILFFAYKKVSQNSYEKGLSEANIKFSNFIFNSLQEKGFVEFTYNQDEENFIFRLGLVKQNEN